jgi:hypothetical protein
MDALKTAIKTLKRRGRRRAAVKKGQGEFSDENIMQAALRALRHRRVRLVKTILTGVSVRHRL